MNWHKYELDNRLYFSNEMVSFCMIRIPDRDYYLGETPVTQSLWMSVMEDNPSHFTKSMLAPVDSISHRDCIRFLAKLNEQSGEEFRLPSVKEWVFAAKGGTNARSYIYAGSNDPEEVGWFHGHTHPVKLKKPNSIGLFDMTGNVWEWCSDIAPTKYVLGKMPSEVITKKDDIDINDLMHGNIERSRIPTFYYLKGGSHVNGYSTSKIQSLNSFGEYYRNYHLGMRLCLGNTE